MDQLVHGKGPNLFWWATNPLFYNPLFNKGWRPHGCLLKTFRYPPHSKSHLSAEAEAQSDAEPWNRHPFHDEAPAADGNFYPHDSKLRPASADEPEFRVQVDVPPYCVLTPGVPSLPISFSGDKSAPAHTKAGAHY